jgi:hypothetical protein
MYKRTFLTSDFHSMNKFLIQAFFMLLLSFAASAQGKVPAPGSLLKYGKYSCTAARYSNGFYEYIPRGSFTITPNGQYSYLGFEKPSTGTFTLDKGGNLLFKGGYLNGGKAEKIDRPNKFFLVFPANPDHRWTCTLVTR